MSHSETALERLFHEARRLVREQRAEFVERECGGDEKLRAELLGLLEFDGPEWEPRTLPELPVPERRVRPASLGPYRIIDTLGEGSMGVVYLAEQEQPIRRRVAVKVVKPGLDSTAVLARFAAEQEALSRMDHAGVARVLDAGISEQGQPYFVMEHVPGVPITTHCDHRRLGIESRLELFVDLCEAVQHAHQKGVIHRDLKPSNVLVATRDGRDEVKVIDFGVAKALHGRLSRSEAVTEIGQFLGTPEFMSPEQADLTAQDVDTRSDVYSLGVLLYVLLTGNLPIAGEQIRASTIEHARRVIRDRDPERASVRVAGLGAEAAALCAARSTDAKSLVARLRRDLDWIVARAMEKDRARRYPTAAELGADLRRHLAHEPVAARPPSLAYLARQFAARHRATVVVVTGALGLLLVTLVVLAWQTRVSARERARAELAEAMALTRLGQAEAGRRSAQTTLDFLWEVLAAGDPEKSGPEGNVRAVLERAAAGIEVSPPSDPEIEARLRWILGRTYLRLGEDAKAETHLSAACATLIRLLGREHADAFEAQGELGLALRKQGRLDPALALLTERHDFAAKHFGAEDARGFMAAGDLGSVLNEMARFAEAERLHRRAAQGLEGLGPAQALAAAIQLLNVGSDLRGQGQPAKAEVVVREALAKLERLRGADDPRTLEAVERLAGTLGDLGRREEALALSRRLVSARKRIYPPGHERVLGALNNLAHAEQQVGHAQEAERLQREALEGLERVHGWSHPLTLAAANNLAAMLQEREDLAGAEAMYRRVLEVRRKISGEMHQDTMLVMNNLASVLRLLGKPTEAVELFERVLTEHVRVRGEGHPQSIAARHNLAMALLDTGDTARALPLFEAAHELGLRNLPKGHWQVAVFRGNLGDCLRRMGRNDEAEAHLLACHELLLSALGPSNRFVRRVAGQLGELYDATGRGTEAQRWRGAGANARAK